MIRSSCVVFSIILLLLSSPFFFSIPPMDRRSWDSGSQNRLFPPPPIQYGYGEWSISLLTKYFITPLASARSSAFVTESVSCQYQYSWYSISFMFACLLSEWSFFRVKQPLMIVAWRFNRCLLHCAKKNLGLNRAWCCMLCFPSDSAAWASTVITHQHCPKQFIVNCRTFTYVLTAVHGRTLSKEGACQWLTLSCCRRIHPTLISSSLSPKARLYF